MRGHSADWATEQAEQEIIRLCHSGLDSHALRRVVFERLQRVMPYEAYWCATTDPSSSLFTSGVADGFVSQEIPRYISNEFFEDDYNKFGDLASRRCAVSTLQVATHGDLRRSRRYREILEPAGLGHEMRAVFRSGGMTWGAMCLHRLRRFEDFTPAHVALFAAITPHLATGLRAALLLNAVEEAPAADGPGLLLVADDYTVLSATPAAELLLDEIRDQSQSSSLPIAILAVVTKLRALEDDGRSAAHIIPQGRLFTRANRWLSIHASRLSRTAEGQIAVIIEQATPHAIAPLVLQAYSLTAREQEVAALVLKGLSTEDISARLCISTLTVQQHLKAIFAKVGVRSRRELVARIFAQSYWPAMANEYGLSPASWSPA